MTNISNEVAGLSIAVGAYPHLKVFRAEMTGRGAMLPEVKPISRAFAPMVREGRFDVSELAIATFLQAKAYGKPLVLLPVVLAAKAQERALLTLVDGPVDKPADLAGRRVGVRAYSQTTGMWLRGVLAESQGVRPEAIRWTTFEDAHVPEYSDPAWAERAAPGSDMMAMLRAGDLDAVIVGNDIPSDPDLRTVFADAAGAGADFQSRHGFLPVNHLLTVRSDVISARPGLAADLLAEIERSAAAAPPGQFRVVETRERLDRALSLAAAYSFEQGLLPRRLTLDDIWAGFPA